MSYSFTVAATSATLAAAAAGAELDNVVAHQPIHAHDRALAENAITGALALLADPPESQDVRVTVSAALSWGSTPDPEQFTGVSLSIAVDMVPATPPTE
jgi:hypothetical protein